LDGQVIVKVLLLFDLLSIPDYHAGMSNENEAGLEGHVPTNGHSKPKADVAAQIVGVEAQTYDQGIERRLIRKIDLCVIPFLWFGYGLVYYDKAILGGASIFGMITSLQLRVVVDDSVVPPITSTQRLSWASSIFYFGMLAGVMPMTYAFQRFHLSRVIGAAVVLWGLCCMSTALVTDHQGLYVQRFFLGFLESIMPTAFMVIVSSFYTQREQTWRQCLWYSATGAWTIIGAGFNYAFAGITSGSLERWQYLYIMAGSITVVYGLCFFLFPQTPNDAFFLRGDEKRISMERLRQSHMGVRCSTIKWDQIREALTDPKVYLISLMMGLAYTGKHDFHLKKPDSYLRSPSAPRHIPYQPQHTTNPPIPVNGAVSAFGPLIVSTFGYTPKTALLWQMPLGAVCLITTLACGYASLLFKNIRLIMLMLCCLPVIAGCAMIWKGTWSEGGATPLAGYTLIGFFAPVTSLIVSMGMANVAGNSKKSFMASGIFVMYCVGKEVSNLKEKEKNRTSKANTTLSPITGNIVGPFWIRSQQVSQHYPRVWQGIIGCYSILIIVAATLYFILHRENARRDALVLDEKEGEKHAFEDLTDKQNLWFRYAY
jgi:MFS family permease